MRFNPRNIYAHSNIEHAEFPQEFEELNPINFNRFADEIPEFSYGKALDTWITYSNAEYYQMLNDMDIPSK